ncbi:acetylcholine receptor subunit beta-type unc-29-like [Ylistrum balloti]|uniref:acetylcholine receptor subunit beta-type unc-29-like n=1 Tax=Ylistrum balloti TaxID=509963 RepID=UPI002905BA19|nr:acetylcholine receptor subunit beta-type unc-29-like [Ylistrum balloti]
MLIILALVALIPSSMSQSSTEGTNLYTALMTSYQKHVRPGTDYSVPLSVNIRFSLMTIQGFDETEGKFSITGFFTITWVDNRLTWTPASYGGLTSTLLSQKEVWKPNMMLSNTYSSLKFLGTDDFYIRYTYTGDATWMPADVFDVSCDADVKYYPFDSQVCKVQFTPWFITPSEVSFTALNSELDVTLFSPNSKWELSTTGLKVISDMFEAVEMQVSFKRRYVFYVVNMILPLCLMTAINSFVFILPVDSGERVGFSITNLLSIAVYLTIVTDALPEASQPQISVLSYLLLTQMAMSVLIMLLTILSIKVYMSEEEKIPQNYVTFVNVMQFKWLKRKSQAAIVEPVEINVEPVSSDRNNKKDVSRRKSPADQQKQLKNERELTTPKTDNDLEVDMTWKTVGHAFDKASLLFVIMSSLIINMTFMVYLIHTYV